MSVEPARILRLPSPPESPAPFRFPWIASLAPLLVAVALWLITDSIFALLFAVLGPVTALATFADSRLSGRRTTRRDRARFADELGAIAVSIRDEHRKERGLLAEASPLAETISHRRGADPFRWRATSESPIFVSVGQGTVASVIRLDTPSSSPDASADDALARLQNVAASLEHAPVRVDARLGIGVYGPPVFARAAARALVLQLAWALSPRTHWCAVPTEHEPWLASLPHAHRVATRPGFFAEFGLDSSGAAVAAVAIASEQHLLPGECAVVVSVGGEKPARIVQHPDPAMRRDVAAGVLSLESAVTWATAAAQDARRDGLVSQTRELPTRVELSTLLGALSGDGAPHSLIAHFAVNSDGPVAIDIVTHGPHAIVGGTTGSGKSELLISWVISLAARYSPDDVTFLLVDFKGGSAFGSLAVLPHTVGIITDLDTGAALRALESLRAEIRYREAVLAEAGVRDVRQCRGGEYSLARLVIMVDEFQAMLSDHPDLHPLFADIAARGRSLGIHLVLCTQRPAGSVRDGVLANADLRISLRVNNAADSVAVVGTSAATELAATEFGRGVIALGDSTVDTVQFAIADSTLPASIVDRWKGVPPPRRPWCEPLPAMLVRGEQTTTTGARVFGLLDLPHEQRHAPAVWNQLDDGHVLVLGASRTGKSTSAAAFAPDALPVPGDAAAAWDVIARFDALAGVTVVLDDVDSLLARLPGEHREYAINRLTALLRDGPARGVSVILTAQRLTSDVTTFAGLIGTRLMLRHASRNDWIFAGGDPRGYESGFPPGGGIWKGHRVQIYADSALSTAPPQPEVDELPLVGPLAVVSTRPQAMAARLGATGMTLTSTDRLSASDTTTEPVRAGWAVVAGVEEWQSRWGLLPALRPTTAIVFDGCTVADYRALMATRDLPPVLAGLDEVGWLHADEHVRRVRLPT